MGEPEIPTDEKILMRSQGVHVKSIPFEGILTNRRIILVDRAKNLLPPKEIPLATIRDVETGENAIRDLTLTISIMAKTGETRQMILTFSRQEGGNPLRDRDAWARLIRESRSTSFERVIRNVIPGVDPAQHLAEPAAQNPTGARPTMMAEGVHPINKILGVDPAGSRSPARSPPLATPSPAAPATGEMVFCTRCGNKVSADSAFCNKCGSPIIVPAAITRPAVAPVSQQAPASHSPAEPVRTLPADVPHHQSTGRDNGRDQAPPPAPASRQAARKPEKKGFLSRLFSPRKRSVPPVKAAAHVPASSPVQKKRRGSLMPGKKALVAGIVVLVVIVALVVAAVFVYPMLTSGTNTGTSDTTSSSVSSTPTSSGSTGSSATTSAVLSNTGVASITVKETPAIAIPQTGVQVHISYIAGWTGSYGMPDDLQQITNSGERVYEVLNATGTIQASITKQDTSKHTLTVEIYKNGQLLASGNTSDASGKVTVTTNVGAAASAAPSPTANAGNLPAATTTAAVTAVKTTAPAASTTF